MRMITTLLLLSCLAANLTHGIDYDDSPIEVCTGDMANRILNNPETEKFFDGSVIKGGGCVFPTKLVVIGNQGAGKSSLANSFLGWERSYSGRIPFDVGHGIQAGTLSSSYASGAWLGKMGSPGVTVIDTPGFNSSVHQLEDMVWMLAEMEEVNMFILVFRYKDRMSTDLANSLKSVGRLLGNVTKNLAVVVSFWSFSAIAEKDRENRRINRKRYGEQLVDMLKDVLDTDVVAPVFFIDSHYNKDDLHERKVYNKETSKLWNFIKDVVPWVSLPPSKLKAQVRRVRRRTGEIKEKCQVVEEDRYEWENKIAQLKNIINYQDQNIMDMRSSIEKMKSSCSGSNK